MKKASCIYSILIGTCMLGIWGILLAAGQVAELSTEPYRIVAHIISEVITAGLLIGGGIAVLYKKAWGKILHHVSLGALLYSVFTAGGYYLQNMNIPMTAMFGWFFAVTALFIIVPVIESKNKNGIA